MALFLACGNPRVAILSYSLTWCTQGRLLLSPLLIWTKIWLDPGPSLIVLVHLYYLQIGPICKYCHIKGKEYHIWMWRKHGSVQHVTSGEISAIVLMVSLHGTCLFLCLSSRSFFMIVFSNLNIHLSLISKSFCWFSQRCKICDLALTV